MKRYWLIIGLFFLVSCSPNEADFKSKVPVSENIVNRSIPPRIPQIAPPSIPKPTPPLALPLVPQFELPSEINLDVPFFSQAPDGNWGLPWQEACEEAAITLAVHYATGRPIAKEQFRATVLGLVEWQDRTFGLYKDTTVAQTAQMIRGYFGFSDFEILEDPTVDQMKKALAGGSVIVAPFSGKDLKNPFYSNGGPVYHMMVIRGYDSNNFITNDVGTKRGENFNYPIPRIMETMHDWNGADVQLGAKRVIVVNRASN